MSNSNVISQEQILEIQRIHRRNLLEKYKSRFTEIVVEESAVGDDQSQNIFDIQNRNREGLVKHYSSAMNDASNMNNANNEQMFEILRRRKEDMMARYVGNLEKMTDVLLPTTKANNASEYENILRNYASILALKKRSLMYRSSL
jgi:hypothetical protein